MTSIYEWDDETWARRQPLTDDDERERLAAKREIEDCCQGRNINCGHHWGRA